MDPTESSRKDASPNPPAAVAGPWARWRELNRARQRLLACGIAFALVLIAVFFSPLVSLFVYASGTKLHSHIVLVPLVSIYLLVVRRHELPRLAAPSPGPAALLLGLGVVAFSAAYYPQWSSSTLSRNDQLAVAAASFVACLAGGGFLFLGGPWVKAAAFPFAFLVFLVPLPDAAVAWLERASMLASAEVSDWLFRLSGTPFLRDGTVFQLPGIAIEVAEECSGIRSSWVLFITGILAANLFLRNPWHRALLAVIVIPLGVLRNGLRILVIGLLCVRISPEMIHSFIHRKGGPIFFALSLVPLFLLLWWLRSRESGKTRTREIRRKIDREAAA